MKRLLVGLALAALHLGCDEHLASPSAILGGTWSLTLLQDAGGAVTVTDTGRYTVQFGDDGRAAIRSDCNSCSGRFTLAGNALDLSPLACTRAFCGDTSLDQRFVAALDRTDAVQTSGSELVLAGGGVTLRFRR